MEYEVKPIKKFSINLKELWEYRELFYFFVWRDIKVKYKQTILGVFWAIFQPAILMLIAVFVIQKKMWSNDANIPYPLFFLSGFLCWNIFSSALSNSGNSMISNAGIIKKIYFPRLIIPISSVISSFFDFIFGFIFYLIVLIYYSHPINSSLIYELPASLLLSFFAATGMGTLISALSIKYRDFRYILPFLIQLLLFASPVFYYVNSNSPLLNYILSVNPMYAPLEIYRMHLGASISNQLILISIFSNITILIIGLLVFKNAENYFADIA